MPVTHALTNQDLKKLLNKKNAYAEGDVFIAAHGVFFEICSDSFLGEYGTVETISPLKSGKYLYSVLLDGELEKHILDTPSIEAFQSIYDKESNETLINTDYLQPLIDSLKELAPVSYPLSRANVVQEVSEEITKDELIEGAVLEAKIFQLAEQYKNQLEFISYLDLASCDLMERPLSLIKGALSGDFTPYHLEKIERPMRGDFVTAASHENKYSVLSGFAKILSDNADVFSNVPGDSTLPSEIIKRSLVGPSSASHEAMFNKLIQAGTHSHTQNNLNNQQP